MKFDSLSTQQKQWLVLGAILAVTLLYVLFQFVLTPAWRSFSADGEEIHSLERNIARSERLLSRRDEIRDELEASGRALQRRVEDYLPPAANPLSWATEQVYSAARRAGVEIDGVSEERRGRMPWEGDEEIQRYFRPYAVNIAASCDYAELAGLVTALEGANPYLLVRNLSITSDRRQPGRHNIAMVVEWPVWMEPAGARAIVTTGSENPEGI